MGKTNLMRPWNDPRLDINTKSAMLDGLFLVAEQNKKIIGTIMGAYEGHRGLITSQWITNLGSKG